jgi:Ni,Fe-hydrogenase III large subunit
MLGARSVQSRFQGVGVVGHQAASEIGMVGLTGRASGVAGDARVSLPGRLYAAHPIASLAEKDGDCWARMTLRMREIGESVRWLNEVLGTPTLDVVGPDVATLGPLWHDTLCVSIREGHRGPIVQALETGPDGRLLQYKVQDPSLLNWFGLALAVRDNEISDFPICNKSFDLSYCGNDL